MTLRPSELGAVAREIERELAGRSVQKVVQPDARTLLLSFPRAWLLVSVAARSGRVHLVDDKPAGTGEAAPAFCMLLRKHLVGARLVSVEPVPGERAVAIAFERANDRPRLLAFLFGTGGHIALVDGAGTQLGTSGAHASSLLPAPRVDEGPPPRFTSSTEIAAFYAQSEREQAEHAHRTSLLGQARRELERLRRLEAQLGSDLARSDGTDELRRDADLLLAHRSEVPRGASEVTLPDDFTDGAPRKILLDPARSVTDNAARKYHDAKRRTRGRKVVGERLATTRAAREKAEHKLAAIADADAASLPSVALRSAAPGKKRSREQPAARPPYKLYRSVVGREILVGRGASKNDQLTFHVARGDDLWLHTRDVAGAHVIVPTSGGRPVDGETLLDAATLAVHHSPARGEAQADVTYTPRKLVRKPRGAAPGLVTVAGGKTLRLRLDEVRLRRLLASLVEE